MNIELPTSRPYGALFAVGNRRPGGVQEIGALIVKAAYRLDGGTGGDSHAMRPDTNAAASAVVMTDARSGADVTREADIAPYKPHVDLVVEGFLGGLGNNAASVDVDGSAWLARSGGEAGIPATELADRRRHLFGYHPRTLAPRAGEAGAPPLNKPMPDAPAPGDFPFRDTTELDDIAGYDDHFLNFHRRSGSGFSVPGAISASLSDGQRVTVHKGATEAFSLTLALPPLTAVYRTWCGRGPDEPPYWTRTPLGAMRADTLILKPEAQTAEVIWRATWPWNAAPADRYRALRVVEGIQ